jgi:hypothetical protein
MILTTIGTQIMKLREQGLDSMVNYCMVLTPNFTQIRAYVQKGSIPTVLKLVRGKIGI